MRSTGGHGFAWGDVNGDGREDVLTEVGWYERPAGDPFARPWTLHKETALPYPSCPFVVKDLNKDGGLDIIFGRGHDVGVYWWEQQAPQADGTTVWKKHVIDDSWSQAHAIALADLDGDGEEELIAGKCIWAHNGDDPGAADPPGIYYYVWNKASVSFARHTISPTSDRVALGRQIQRDRSERRRPARSHGPEQAGALDLSERRFQIDRPPTTAPSREFQKHFTCLEGRRPAGTSRMHRRSETS